MRFLATLKMKLYFSDRNNTKYILPLKTLISSYTLSNLIHYGFAPTKVLYEMS